MQLVCNGERVKVDAERLADVIRALGYGERGAPKVVVAVNDCFVPKAEWTSYQVRAEDRLDILSAMQGG